MAFRASWKGYLKLSLVSCAVQLFPATTTKERVTFNLLNRETGNRLRRQLVDAETGDVVESDEQVKGYEIGKRQYVQVEEEEIQSVAIESTHTIDIESFVPRAEIDDVYLDTPYYLTPDGRVAEEAFSVIREAMREKGVVGLGRVVLYRRERIVMLEPREKGLVARTLRYAYEVRDPVELFEDIGEAEVSEEMLDLATHIIERKLTRFDPSRFDDRYQDALVELIKAKTGEEHAPLPKAQPAPSNVVNLMDALRRSIAAEKGEEKARPKKAAKAEPAKSAARKAPPARKEKAGRPAARSGRLRKAG
ncbi:MAG TPA: Ku protein [Beijerinckiaceae bacterium]|nr:Ku protein [Beijerinckiaceae bacterium]